MAKQVEEVAVKFTTDSSQVGRELDQTVKDVDIAAESFEDLSGAITDTGEQAIDSATGITGLGAAITSMGKKLIVAAKGLSTFSKALIATGIGAAIAGIALLVAYWEDIAKWIGIAEENLDDYNDETDRTNRILGLQIKINEALGRSVDELRKKQLQLIAEQKLAALEFAIANETFDDGLEVRAQRIEEIRKEYQLAVAQLGAFNIAINKVEDDITPDPADPDASTSIVPGFDEDLFDPDDDPYFHALVALDDNVLKLQEETGKKAQKIFDDDLKIKLDASKKSASDQTKVLADAAKAQARIDDLNFQGKKALVAGTSQLLQVAAGENQQLQGTFMIAEAIANTALAVTAYLGAPWAIAGVVALGAAQVATIAQQMNVSADSNVTGQGFEPDRRDPFQFEREGEVVRTASPVLVLEDFNTVQNRVNVTEDRASIGPS